MTGVVDALEGPLGFFPVFGRGVDPAPAWQDLEKTPMILDCAIKKWCVGSPNQAPLDAIEAIGKETKLVADEIESITVRLPTTVIGIVDNGPMADVCCQHLVALTIVDGKLTFENSHDQARMSDPALLAVRKRVTLVGDEELTQAHPPRQGIVEIKLRNGKQLRHHTKVVRGTPQNPMGAEEVVAKSLDLIRPILGAAQSQRLVDAVRGIEKIPDMAEFAKLLATKG
jgi:2-methylcitrate dehydratase PrpD